MALQTAAGRSTSTRNAPPPKPQRVSMSPETFTSGGLINDVDITISDAQTTTWDMNGAVSGDTPFLAVEMTDGNGTQHVQYYSAGKPEDWQPEDSGEGFTSNSGKTAINGSTNLGMFLSSLVEAGFPSESLADGNLKVIIGTQAHVKQKTLERQGLIRTGKNANRPNQVLLVEKIIALPGTGAGVSAVAPKTSAKPTASVAGKPTVAAATATTAKPAGGKPNGQAAAAPASEDEIRGQMYLALNEGLTTDPIPVKGMAKIVYDYFKREGLGDKLANAAVAQCNKQSFRATLEDNGIVYDSNAGTVALAE